MSEVRRANRQPGETQSARAQSGETGWTKWKHGVKHEEAGTKGNA
ncbi:MAG: hypothetical protein Q4E53_07635 [Eubacteriales bacterium]|nr:hypothetical protein [Eubacteriales bacterium]